MRDMTRNNTSYVGATQEIADLIFGCVLNPWPVLIIQPTVVNYCISIKSAGYSIVYQLMCRLLLHTVGVAIFAALLKLSPSGHVLSTPAIQLVYPLMNIRD